MSADCMNPNLDYYVQHQQTSCPTSPPDATYGCLCASNTFLSWYMTTLCVNCNGTQLLQNPLSNLTKLCPTFASVIETSYSDGCSPYVKLSQPETTGSSSSSSSSGLTTSSTTTSSSSSNPTSDGNPTTIILSITTPSPSRLSTVTAVAASPFRATHPIPLASSNSTILSTSPTSSSPNATYTSTSMPTPQLPLTDSSSSSTGMSTGAKAGIGVGAAAAAIGIGFFFMALLTILRRRNSRMKGPGYGRHDVGYTGRGVGGGSGGLGDTSTTLTEMYQDDDSQLYRGFGGSDRYGSNGLGIAGIGGGPREKMGLVPSGRIREVRVGGDGEHRGSEFALPLHAEGVREIHGADERTSVYADEDYVAPQESDGVWHSAVEQQGPWTRRSTARDSNYEQQDAGLQYSLARESTYQRHDAETRYSTAQESNYEQHEAGTRHSTAHESNYEAAMRPKSRIYSVVDSPVLDLGQGDLSREELERLEEEERRIDEAIRESESRARMRAERGSGSIGKAL